MKLVTFDHMKAKVDALYQKLDNLSITPNAVAININPNYETCGILRHFSDECQFLVEPILDEVNYA